MKRFFDEEGKVWTLNQLKADFDELKANGEVEDDATFSDYIKDCTDKDGALTEITKADAERDLKEAHTIYLEIWDDYQTGYAHYEDLRIAFESYSDAIKLLKSFDEVK